MKTAVPKRYERSRPDRTSDALATLGGRDDHRQPERNARYRRVVHPSRSILPGYRGASETSGCGRLPYFSGHSGSPPLTLPTTGCQSPAMVLVPTRGLEFGCFRSAYNEIRYVHIRSVRIQDTYISGLEDPP